MDVNIKINMNYTKTMLYVIILCIITLKQHFHLLFLRFTCIFILFDSLISCLATLSL